MAPLTAEDVFAFVTLNVPESGVHWARELASEQPGPKSDRPFDLGSTAASCLPTKDSRLGSTERSANELLDRSDRT